MQHFQSILIFIGLLAIGAVLIHGYLTHRKEKKVLFEKKITTDIFSEKENSDPTKDGIIDDLAFSHSIDEDSQEQIDFSISEDDHLEDLHFDGQEDSDNKAESNIHISDSDSDLNDSLQESSLNASETDQEKTDGKVNYFELEADDKNLAENDQSKDVFIYNVVAKQGSKIFGNDLLQFFLTSGFRFGERSIFHRHLHSDGNGPILFSIANMVKPGVFDPDRMGRIACEGVSFFIVAPNPEINIKTAFDMMLTAVGQMTEEFDCVVLNADRTPLTEQEYRDDHQRLMRYV
ncbi:cell division protein ZipA [Psychromonas sp. MB-3u-54]|uniref:cell division protein ZipA n=1 Tax=Psychromonas sp. MB-3u-54 TaxID=2058319 RepID=UPI000C33A0D1|nr:cell division protein ZipA [Psychromonas sp. MB-3u-54]PKH03028.1 cell division protein ZipA [Psychromonas sp. MB-3u-54]